MSLPPSFQSLIWSRIRRLPRDWGTIAHITTCPTHLKRFHKVCGETEVVEILDYPASLDGQVYRTM